MSSIDGLCNLYKELLVFKAVHLNKYSMESLDNILRILHKLRIYITT